MSYRHQTIKQRALTLLIALCTLIATVAPAIPTQAAANTAQAAAQTSSSVTLTPTDDARTQPGSPDTNFEEGFLWVGHPNVHFSLLKFDLSQLPADATIDSADLQLYFTGIYTGTNEVEVGRVDGNWDEATLTGSTAVTYTWSGQFQTVTSSGKTDGSTVDWNVTPLVKAWHAGTVANDGLALRGNGGELKAAHSKETGVANDRGPKLIINYTLPADDGQPHPDLGDAPDSSNHHPGQNNTAYRGTGVLGQFPTVWDMPAGQVAGPRHANKSMEGWLGNFLTSENEADQGPDQDTPRNNILRNSVTGNIADVADNDRGDDGWRNRTVKFFDCQRQTLDIRISKGANATRQAMYLNVWFDGNRDGDWGDLGQCQANEEEPAQARYEWIVQNYIVDMGVIPAGGAYDFSVLTEKVLNDTPILPHWMRFSLSEEPAVQPAAGGLPDGRGPHPTSPLGAFQFGETEDLLQKPSPAGQDGELVLQKRVITEESPVDYAGTVTYEIKLRHEGGSQPIQAQIRDELDYPLHLLPQIKDGGLVYIDVSSATGGAAPLQADLGYNSTSGPINQIVSWRGTLEPNAEIVLRFDVHIHPLCTANQQTETITNVVQARPKGGTSISAEATFEAKCPGYNPASIQIDPEPISDLIDLADLAQVQWRGTLRNNHAFPVTLGAVFEPNGANTEAQSAAVTAPLGLRLLDRITLAANETRLVNLDLRLETKFTDELSLADDVTIGGKLSFCFLEDESNSCPDAASYPNLVVNAPPVVVLYRPRDLGDAPDSTNHAGVNMAAYAGVQANFPTVFDPATGVPEGPLHRHPRPFHLGQRVSLEAEADIGPDQDPLNNILPTANDPDNDRGDDGTNLALWNLNNCQATNLPVQVAITPQAVNYFQNLGTPGYLNIWVDSNRDGDWADATQCGQQPAVEHVVIDFPINVVGLGAGLQLINVPTGLVPWPATDKPAWVRVTLSERPSNKTLTAGALNYGDGRGYPLPFKTGETEDYLYRPAEAGGGPDLALHMTARTRKVTAEEPGLQAAAINKLGNFEIQDFKIDIENVGNAGVEGALLEFQIPEKLRGQKPSLLRAPGIPSGNISFSAGKVSMILPFMEQNSFIPIVMGWYGCITCTLASNVAAAGIDADYTGIATVTVDGDIATSNNEVTATARGLLSSPIIGAFMDYTDDACMDRIISSRAVTNQTTVALRGKGEPNQIIAILIGLLKVAEVTSDANGNFQYTATLTDGIHEISARNVTSPRDPASGLATGRLKLLVNSALAYDPMSSCFVDSNGRSYSLPTLGSPFGALQVGSWIKTGETYQVFINTNGSDPNQALRVTFNDVVISSLVDPDLDGTYVGMATFPSGVQAASVNATDTIGVVVGTAGNQISYSSEITTASDGVISNGTSGQPVANATVNLLVAQDADDGSSYFVAASNQNNPQVTVADGAYRYSAADGLYRIDVVADGYQPYRTATINAATSPLNRTIALSPAIADAATQTVYITANGFAPATVTVTPGTVIEFVNVDLAEHGIESTGWDSGLLATGEGYKVKVDQAGTFTYSDSTDGFTQGRIVVDGTIAPAAFGIYLPLIQR